MCCFLIILIFLGPRVAGIVWWLMRPEYFWSVFGNWLWPVLGLIFLPWTTLAYAAVAPGGISPFEWFLLIFAFLIDLAAYSGGAYHNKNRSRE